MGLQAVVQITLSGMTPVTGLARRQMAFALLALCIGLLFCCPQIANGQPQTGFSTRLSLPQDNNQADAKKTQSDTGAGHARKAHWWRIPQNSNLSVLSVASYAPDGQHQPMVAIRFSQPLQADSGYQQYLAVYDPDNGARVRGVWHRASDPHLIFFSLPAAGRYLVYISAGLADSQGHTLNHSMYGPVTVP